MIKIQIIRIMSGNIENENENKNDINYLARKNPHFRDEMITFDEGPHIYTINGDSGFTCLLYTSDAADE